MSAAARSGRIRDELAMHDLFDGPVLASAVAIDAAFPCAHRART